MRRVPGMKAARSYQVPRCKVSPKHVMFRDLDGLWSCRDCGEDLSGLGEEPMILNRAQRRAWK